MTSSSKPARRANPRRILVPITSSGLGGAEKIARTVVTGLDPREFEVVFCSLRPPGETAKIIAASGRDVVSLEMAEAPGVAEMARAVRALVRLIDERQIELIHSFLYRANVLARIATRFSRARPIVLSGHHSLTPPPSGGIAVWSERLTHRMSDLCVAVSPAVRDRLVEHDRAPREKVVVVPNGVDTRHFLPTEREPSAGGKLVIGAAGRLSPVKGFDILMAVVAVLRNRGLDVELRVAGSGSEEQPLREAAHRLGLNGHVRMLGALPDLAGFYSGLDAFVLSSLEEASPTVVLEAMACGLPVVATRCGGARDMIEHEVSGLFVTPGSRAELAEGIARVAGDARLRASLAARARERAVERFDVTAMVDNHARLYRSCLEHRAVPS